MVYYDTVGLKVLGFQFLQQTIKEQPGEKKISKYAIWIFI